MQDFVVSSLLVTVTGLINHLQISDPVVRYVPIKVVKHVPIEVVRKVPVPQPCKCHFKLILTENQNYRSSYYSNGTFS